MSKEKSQFSLELEDELGRISKKPKWSAKDAGRLAADAVLANHVTDATIPPQWRIFSESGVSMVIAIGNDARTANFTDAQRETVCKYGELGMYAVKLSGSAIVWEAVVLNTLKDMELQLRRAYIIILSRLARDNEILADMIPPDVVDGLPNAKYGEAIAAEFIDKYSLYFTGAYDTIVNPLCDLLTWNIIAPRAADIYGIPALSQLQLEETKYIRGHIVKVRESMDELVKLSGAEGDGIKALFDVDRIASLYHDYNVMARDVTLQCDGKVTSLLKSYRIEEACVTVTEELKSYGKRAE